MSTVIHYAQRGNGDRNQRWDRLQRADLGEQLRGWQAQGVSQRQAAKGLDVPRSTLQAWHAYQESLEAGPAVVAFFHRVPGRAFLHRLVLALHVGFVEIGACGIRLVGLVLERPGLNRFVGASFGTQQQINRGVEEAMVAYRGEEPGRLAPAMTPQDITVPQDETFTGGLCLVALEPVSNSILLEQTAEARDHETWNECLEDALAPLKGNVIQSTRDEAPGLLAYVAQPLGAHHSPDLFHGQHELSQAVSAPLAVKQRAAAKAPQTAEDTLNRVQEHRDTANAHLEKRGPGRPPKVAPSRAQIAQEVTAVRQKPQHLTRQRDTVAQPIRASGHADHCVDLDRGVRRPGKRIAGEIQEQIDTIRTIARQAGLSQACRDRIEKAPRVVPKMQATIEFVSGYVRQQVRQLDLAPPVSYAMPAHLMPAYSLDRVAAPKPRSAGQALRALANRLRRPLFEPDGAWGEWSRGEQDRLKHKAMMRAEVFQRSSSNVEGRHGSRSLRHPPLRGRTNPRKRACLTAVPNFLLMRPDGTTAAERFFGQKPRSRFPAVLASVEIPPAPLSPPRRAVG